MVLRFLNVNKAAFFKKDCFVLFFLYIFFINLLFSFAYYSLALRYKEKKSEKKLRKNMWIIYLCCLFCYGFLFVYLFFFFWIITFCCCCCCCFHCSCILRKIIASVTGVITFVADNCHVYFCADECCQCTVGFCLLDHYCYL